MKTTISISGKACRSCANAIHKELASINGVFGVKVDWEHGEVVVDHTDEVRREQLEDKLTNMDYKEECEVEKD